MLYGVIHSIVHLSFSLRIMADATTSGKNITITIVCIDVNDCIKEKMSGDITYNGLLFGTLTGVTGIILLISILAMAITSLRCIRSKCFQVFGYTHMALFPVFLLTLVIHGFGFWFTVFFPTAVV